MRLPENELTSDRVDATIRETKNVLKRIICYVTLTSRDCTVRRSKTEPLHNCF